MAIVPYYSDDVVIRDVRILAPTASPNTDAIDPFSSSNIVIDHVYSDVGDDNVAIKSGPINSPGPDDTKLEHCDHRLHFHARSWGVDRQRAFRRCAEYPRRAHHFDGTDNGIRVKSNRDRGHDVGNLVFRDLTMKDVRNPIIISEYYPKVMPPADEAPQPVQRLTPLFHDIIIENVTATGADAAAVIAGLPESPVKNVVLKNVKISAKTGMTIGYAHVTGEGVSITPEQGEAVTKMTGAEVVLTK